MAEGEAGMLKLRPYQQKLADEVERLFVDHNSVLASLPTGGGKTEVALGLIFKHARPDNRALVVVERKVLCHQWASRIAKHGNHVVGVLQGENTAREWANIIVATAQTIKARRVPDNVGLVVIDESHIWHATHDDILAKTGAKVLGLTATPLREGLGLRFEKIAVGATIKELIELGHLIKPRYFAPSQQVVGDALDGVHVRAGDFASDELSEALRTKAIIGDVVTQWQRYGEDRQTIAFCVDKAHAREMAEQFMLEGIKAASITDDTPDEERAELFKAFEDCRIRVLTSVGVLSVGFDSPIASCAILARPTLSLGLFVQQGGRVLRPYPNKTDCIILDHAGNTLRHGLLEDFIPPDDLNQIDKKTDKKTRKEKSDVWTCKHCSAVNSYEEDICSECGNPRRVMTRVVVVDGYLQQVGANDPRYKVGEDIDDIRRFYLEARGYFKAKNLTEGMAYYATAKRFKLAAPKMVIKWDWKDLPAAIPSGETSRWLINDYRQKRLLQSKGYG
jgi:DNA repair protein RadD